jgi:hypothetical protein
LAAAGASLRHFQEPHLHGFVHQDNKEVDPTDPFSKASTATCVVFLDAVGTLDQVVPASDQKTLRERMIDGGPEGIWASAGLPPDNPFTVSFLLEAIVTLGGIDDLDKERQDKVNSKLAGLEKKLETTGGLAIQDYDPTAFLTYKALHVLRRWRSPGSAALEAVREWNWAHLAQESMLIASKNQDADVFELAYSVLTASAAARLDEMSPRERWLLQFALEQFFGSQRSEDGTWPRSRPLFLYPHLGYAYCFDYELLVSMLSENQLFPLVFSRLQELRKAALTLDDRRFPLGLTGATGEPVYGWSSGHHGRKRRAESWATASVFHFCHELNRLVSEAIRRDVFDYAGARYTQPKETVSPFTGLPSEFLDSTIHRASERRSLKQILSERFIGPLVAARDGVRRGVGLPDDVLTSAIFYGPPGTSKTQLAELISEAVGWPLLPLDPSHLTREGIEQVHAEADRLFGKLELCDQVIVLLDEFDELVREREGTGEFESRFLTTAMLPKLMALSKRRRLVYIVATNHLEQFDAAIRRPGRFDMIIPVMPPSASEKLQKWQVLAKSLDCLAQGANQLSRADAEVIVGDLTFDETKELVRRLSGKTGPDEIARAIEAAGATATLHQSLSEGDSATDWKTRMVAEESRIRIRGYDF